MQKVLWNVLNIMQFPLKIIFRNNIVKHFINNFRNHITPFEKKYREAGLRPSYAPRKKYSTSEMSNTQWCSGKFALVGTLAWHYNHIPYDYLSGGGGGGGWGFLNESSFFKGKNRCSNIVVY